jgi:hypothetical protein
MTNDCFYPSLSSVEVEDEMTTAAQPELLPTTYSDRIGALSFAPSAAMGRIQAGQRARLRLDGFAWTEYGQVSATVGRILCAVVCNY